jgi:putative DNA primase/helicase
MSEYQRAELVGRRLVVAKENEQAKHLNTEFIKSLTGGETISARHPYGRPFNFKPVAKFFLGVNHKPIIRDDTHGMWRRIRLVPFVRTFPVNPGFAEALIEHRASVLAWAVRGPVRYYREGLQAPESVLAATKLYQRDSNALTPFLEDRCVVGRSTPRSPTFSPSRAWPLISWSPDLLTGVGSCGSP